MQSHLAEKLLGCSVHGLKEECETPSQWNFSSRLIWVTGLGSTIEVILLPPGNPSLRYTFCTCGDHPRKIRQAFAAHVTVRSLYVIRFQIQAVSITSALFSSSHLTCADSAGRRDVFPINWWVRSRTQLLSSTLQSLPWSRCVKLTKRFYKGLLEIVKIVFTIWTPFKFRWINKSMQNNLCFGSWTNSTVCMYSLWSS